jgi:hypothetical protein
VPRLPGDDRVEAPPGGVPVLELRHLDVEPARPGEVGHPRVGVDAEHPAAGRLEEPSRDPRAAAGVDHVAAGALGDDPVHHRGRIAESGAVVAAGVGAERLGHLALRGDGGEGPGGRALGRLGRVMLRR